MTIQEMFDLLRDYRDAVDKVNNHADTTLTPMMKKMIMEEYHLAQEVAHYLPRFTPMHCKHCRYNSTDCIRNNRQVGLDYCGFYEVESLEEFTK